MKEKISPKKAALSLAIVIGIIYTACAILFYIAPAGTLGLFKQMFHGIDISLIARTSVPLIETLTGLITIIISALIVGWLFAKIYNTIKE